MTLEVRVAEVVNVGDFFGPVKQFFAKLVSWLASDAEDQSAEPDEETDGNKAPPANNNQPKDLGVNVEDQPKAQESFGP